VDRAVPLKTLLRWSESLSAIARTGLGFTESLYEQERFEEILKVAADIRVEADENDDEVSPDAEGLVQEWLDTVGKGVPGYVTPRWRWAPPSETTKGNSCLFSGRFGYLALSHRVVRCRLLGGRSRGERSGGGDWHRSRASPAHRVLDGLRLGFTRVPLYSLLFYCRAVGGELAPHPLETRDVGWLPATHASPMVGVERWGEHVFAALAGEQRDVLYDSVRQPMWRGDSPALMALTVEAAAAVDTALLDAVAALVPQLSRRLRHRMWPSSSASSLTRHHLAGGLRRRSHRGHAHLATFLLPTGVRPGSKMWSSTMRPGEPGWPAHWRNPRLT